MNKAQVSAFGIILLIFVFVVLFVYSAPFFGTASDIMSVNNNDGVGGWFFSNWQNMILLIFIIVVLYKVAFG